MKKVDILKDEKIYDFFTKRIKYAYPVYEIGYKKNLSFILKNLNKIDNLYTVGRLGLFNYNNMDHCLDMSKIISKIILENKSKDEWNKIYLDLSEYIQSSPPGTDFNIYIGFTRNPSTLNVEMFLDNIKLIHY